MGNNYAINSIGSYANDPYFMYALSSYNPNQAVSSSTNTQQAPNTDSSQATNTATATDATTTTPSFKANPKEESSSSAGTVALLGTIIAGTGASIYALKKGNKKGFEGFKAVKEGFKEIWHNITGKAKTETTDASAKITNFFRKGGENITETVIKKDGVTYYLDKNKKITKIVTSEKKVLEGDDLNLWKTSHEEPMKNLDLDSEDVKLVNILSEEKIGDIEYQIIKDEKGKVIKISKKTGSDYEEIKDLEKFKAENQQFIEKQETFVDNWKDKTFTISENGRKTDLAKDVTVRVRDGKIEVLYKNEEGNFVHLKDEEVKLFQEQYADDIKLIGTPGHGVQEKDCIFETVIKDTGNKEHVVRFEGSTDRQIKDVTERNYKTLESVDDVQGYIKDQKLDDTVFNNGNIPEGYTVEQLLYRDKDSDNVFKVVGDEIESVTVGSEVKTGKELEKWLTIQANKNEYDNVLAQLK